jgi:hypothetical protein
MNRKTRRAMRTAKYILSKQLHQAQVNDDFEDKIVKTCKGTKRRIISSVYFKI